MNQLTLLGTGNAMVTECYNTCFAISAENEFLLVDGGGGNGILKQLKAAKIGIGQIRYVFLSHCHIDHILGLLWVIRAYGALCAKEPCTGPLTIMSHEIGISTLKTMVAMLLNRKQALALEGKLHYQIITHGEEVSILGQEMTVFDIGSTKDKQMGFALRLVGGKRLVFLGDEPYRESLSAYALDADYLLHEAFCSYKDRDLFEPYKKHHVTVKEACENGQALGAKTLILYHTEDKTIHTRKKAYTEEGKIYYEGRLLVPEDLEVIDLV